VTPPIQLLFARETDVLTLQEDKISYVLSGKNLLSDAGTGNLLQSVPEVLGTQIARIEEFLKDVKIKDFMMNRRKDLETGETKHYVGSDLDMKKDFDIRRLKKIRSYKGIRHTNKSKGVRGQRTRSNFRKKGQAVRVKKR